MESQGQERRVAIARSEYLNTARGDRPVERSADIPFGGDSMLRVVLTSLMLTLTLLGNPCVAQALDEARLQSLIEEARALAGKDIIMPIEEIRVAAQLAEVAGSESGSQNAVISKVRAELWDHENFHVRRVAVNSIRRIGRFDSVDLPGALIAKLEDPHPWVRYDAAWAIEAAGYRTPEAISALKKLAAGTQAPSREERDKISKSDASRMSKIRAAEALQKLGGR